MAIITQLEGRWRLPSKARKIHADNPPPVTNIATYKLHKTIDAVVQVRPDPGLTPFLFDRDSWATRTRNVLNNTCDEFLTATDDINALVDLLESQLRIAKAKQLLKDEVT